MIERSLLLGFVGALVAFVAGGLGIGGGVLTVPVLYYLGSAEQLPADHTAHIAVAASLAMAFVLSLSATGSYLGQMRVQWTVGLIFSGGSALGAFAASRLAGSLPSELLAGLFGVLLLLNGLLALRPKPERGPGDEPSTNGTPRPHYTRMALLPLAGSIVGVASGMTGIGGGVLMVPFFVRFLRFPTKDAIATSSFCIVFTSLSGTLGFLTAAAPPGLPDPHLGYLYLPYALPMCAGGILGGYIGAKVSGKMKAKTLRAIFGALQVVVGVKLLWDVLL